MADFSVTNTTPSVYLDPTGKVINGFRVNVFYPEFNETHFFDVPTLDPNVVKLKAIELLDQRRALMSIGEETPTGKSK